MTTFTTPPHDSTAQHVAAGLYVTHLYDPRIIIFHVHDVHAATIDAWYEGNKEAILTWPADVPFRSVHDLNAGQHVIMTPRVRALGLQLLYMRKDFRGRTAIATHSTLGATIVNLFMRIQTASPIKGAVFPDLAQALSWLRQDF